MTILSRLLPWLLLSLALPLAAEEAFVRPPAPGPYVGLRPADFAPAQSFTADDVVLAATYFYWYDSRTRMNTVYEGGRSAFRHVPAGAEDYTYKSVDWHKRQLRDMMAAGIDVVLPVYWGAVDGKPEWCFDGVKLLVQAIRELQAAGEQPPKIGCFYATIQLSWGPDGPLDLRTPYGREYFYTTVRDFWAVVPPDLWAMIGGQPLMLLYAASLAGGHDQSSIDHLRTEFARDFAGRTPYIVRGDGWDVQTESRYSWGAAAFGPSVLGAAAIGPGYDDSIVPGRTPLIVDREDGAFYTRAWETLLRLPPAVRPRLVHIETWNELHEATEICETVELGRQYIELTRKFGDMYRQGVQLPRSGPYASRREAWCEPGVEHGEGLKLLPEVGDGPSEPGERGGRRCRVSLRNPYGAADLLYFALDDSFAFYESGDQFVVRVSYFDGGVGTLLLEYDSNDPRGSVAEGAFKPGGSVALTGSQRWRTASFRLPDARFANRTHGGDFRLGSLGTPLAVSRVRLQRLP